MIGAEAACRRRNGELVFEAPWEAALSAMAVGARPASKPLDWEEFREPPDRRRSRAWEREHGDESDDYSYYERWLAALERLVLETGMVSAQEVEAEVLRVAAADLHDHGHDH